MLTLESLKTPYQKQIDTIDPMMGFIYRVSENECTELRKHLTDNVKGLLSNEDLPQKVKIELAQSLINTEMQAKNYAAIVDIVKRIDETTNKVRIARKKNESQLKVSARVLGQADRQSNDPTCPISSLPTELLERISIMTGNAASHDELEATHITREHFGKPFGKLSPSPERARFFAPPANPALSEGSPLRAVFQKEAYFSGKKVGQWALLQTTGPETSIVEIGINKTSGLRGVATPKIQILKLPGDETSVQVFDKSNSYKNLFGEEANKAIAQVEALLDSPTKTQENTSSNKCSIM